MRCGRLVVTMYFSTPDLARGSIPGYSSCNQSRLLVLVVGNGYQAVVQRIEKIDPSDAATDAMVKVPTHHLAFVSPSLFLDSVIKNQHTIITLHQAHS